MLQQLAPAFRMTLLLTVLTGLFYPGVVTGLCQVFFHDSANGSLIVVNGQVVGSELIGQNFAKPEVFPPSPFGRRQRTATIQRHPAARIWDQPARSYSIV